MFLKIGTAIINFDKVCYISTDENNILVSFDGKEEIYFHTRSQEELEIFIKTINHELKTVNIVEKIVNDMLQRKEQTNEI